MGCKMKVCIIGPGLVGSALISQLEQSARRLKGDLEIKVIGVVNSKKMLWADNDTGLDLLQWKNKLHLQGQDSDLGSLLQHMKREAGTPATKNVFIDLTASQVVPDMYARWLSSKNAHVITANKRMGAGPWEKYKEVQEAQKSGSTRFFYEATVGAGLPIISTLQSLLKTGDEIEQIEGILSGTLSFIFNSFGPDRSFSSVVSEAKEAGYTEPDPRDDLSGTDVARKVVILARECGSELNLEDVEVETLVPKELQASQNADSFMEQLPQYDDLMAARAQKASSEGKKLCYVGCVDLRNAKVSVKLKAYPRDHAFAQLSGSDNIVSFTTKRYKEQPLFIRGPGAGAVVTAAGVFSDLVTLGQCLGAQC